MLYTAFLSLLLEDQRELNDIVDLFNKRNSNSLKYVRDINDAHTNSGSLLLICSMYGYTDLVEKIIKLGAYLEDYDHYYRTALCWGLYKHKKFVESLLKAGANPNVKITKNVFELNKMPILYWLINYSDIRTCELKLLIKYGVILSDYKLYLPSIPYRKTEFFSHFFEVLAKRRWVYIKCVVIILGIHKRAVVTANHPDRLLQQGVFQEL